MTHKTAETLLPAIYRSLLSKNSTLRLKGQMIFIGEMNSQLKPILLDELIKKHVITKVSWYQGGTHNATTTNPDTSTEEVIDRSLPSETDTSSSSETDKTFKKSICGTLLEYLPSMGRLNEAGKAVVNTLYNVCSQPINMVAASLTTTSEMVNEEQKEFNQAIETWVKLSNERIKELEQKIQQQEMLQKTQINVSDTLSKEVKAERKELKQLQQNLALYEDTLPQLHDHWMNKQAIAKEQQQLLHDDDPAIRIFYKKMLTELSGIFLLIFLLQNSTELIQRTDHKFYSYVNAAANKTPETVATPMPKGTLNQIQWFFKEKLKKDFLMSAKRGFSNLIVATAKGGSLIGSVLANLEPISGKVVSGAGTAASLYIGYREKQKLTAMQEEFAGFTPKTLEKLAERIARKVTQSYAMSIRLLTEESAKHVAQKGVLKIMIALLANDFSLQTQDEALDLLLAMQLSLHNFYAVLDIHVDLAMDFKFLKKQLKLKNHLEGIKITVDDIYQNTGICFYSSEQEKMLYFSNDDAGDHEFFKTKSQLVGFMQVDESTYRHFIRGLIYDEEGEIKCNQLKSSNTSVMSKEKRKSTANPTSPVSSSLSSGHFSSPIHTKIRSEIRQESAHKKHDSHNTTVNTIFAAGAELKKAKNNFNASVKPEQFNRGFSCVVKEHKLIIEYAEQEELEELRKQLRRHFWPHSFKKCLICDKTLIISFYREEHAVIIHNILNEKLITSFKPAILRK